MRSATIALCMTQGACAKDFAIPLFPQSACACCRDNLYSRQALCYRGSLAYISLLKNHKVRRERQTCLVDCSRVYRVYGSCNIFPRNAKPISKFSARGRWHGIEPVERE